ncbi:hypothetical protein WICPIJ_008751 [Wickerhamomyces pijperi]|uniref:Trimethylguanosine synthase n=1 Tax=Wickerhamomyces pijperi TaxID=599730 RepID=A0A9P8THN2_WICPI|nr:hypothetical protein WICPIJ_008751 [Wickerhamomyces pijperi]
MTIDLYLPQRKKFENQPEKFQLSRNKLEKGSKKFWNQRYSLFSKFDQGVFMNQELWYSVTPESIAIFLAKFIQACDPEIKCILDVFCGGGGNTIQFARKFDKCIGLDFNQENLYCTENNCYVYGVEQQTELILGDWAHLEDETMEYLQQEVDFLFASPPWGGTGYKNKNMFDLDYLLPLSIRDLLISFFKISKNVCLFLPRNSNLIQLSEITKELLGPDAYCRVIYTYTEGFIKGLLVFFGDKFMPENIDKDTLAEQNTMIMQQFKEEQESLQKGRSNHSQETLYDQMSYQHEEDYTEDTVSTSTTNDQTFNTTEPTQEEEYPDPLFFTDTTANNDQETNEIIHETSLKRKTQYKERKKQRLNKKKRKLEMIQQEKINSKKNKNKKQRTHTHFQDDQDTGDKNEKNTDEIKDNKDESANGYTGLDY